MIAHIAFTFVALVVALGAFFVVQDIATHLRGRASVFGHWREKRRRGLTWRRYEQSRRLKEDARREFGGSDPWA